MHRPARLAAAITVATTAVLVGPAPPTHATTVTDVAVASDPLGDLGPTAFRIPVHHGSSQLSPTRGRRTGEGAGDRALDVRGMRASYDGDRVRVVLRADAITPRDDVTAVARIRTDTGATYETGARRVGPRDKVLVFYRTDRQGPEWCGDYDTRFISRADTVTVLVDAGCLGDPASVRVGAALAGPDPDAADTARGDDARRGGGFDDGVIGLGRTPLGHG